MKPEWTKAIVAAVLSMCIAGCEYPMDVEGTTQHVVDHQTLRAGLIDGDDQALRHAADLVADRVNARVVYTKGSAEGLMRKLEHGDLDMVVGRLAKDSPWKTRVTLTSSPSVQDPPKSEPVVRAALRLGENRWYMFVEKSFKGGSA